jgi:hypothetical protein
MAEKKSTRVTNLVSHGILIFVLLCTVLILVEVGGNLINDGVIGTEQVPDIGFPSSTPGAPTPSRPTPTLPPINDA